jgi:hypothetical protein
MLLEGHTLDTPLRVFAEHRLGVLRETRFCGWDHAESLVWEIFAENGQRAFLKQHRQPRKFVQERHAYNTWVPQLPPLTPTLLDVSESYALLLSAVPGVIAERASLTPQQERELHRQAGMFLKKFHDLPFEDTDPVPLTVALRMRTESWSARAKGVVEDDVLTWVREQTAEITLPEGAVRVPCHRDYTPRNWLVDIQGTPQLYVIDFEHAGPQFWLLDLRRLWAEIWPARSDLKVAFLEGYGRPITDEDEQLMRRLAAHSALSTIVWAREHHDRAFEAHGWQALERLRKLQR